MVVRRESWPLMRRAAEKVLGYICPVSSARGAGGAGKPSARERTASCADSDCSTAIPDEASSCNSDSGGESPVPSRRGQSERKVIILDWDDTLLPTSFFAGRLGTDPAGRTAHAAILEAFLRAACEEAHVAIVTLSRRPWVLRSGAAHLPGLNIETLLGELGITVYYASEHAGGFTGGTPTMQDYTNWKRNAMAKVVANTPASDVGAQLRLNVMSVGDAEIEKQALRDFCATEAARSTELPLGTLCKTVKLAEQPTMTQLGQQLQDLGRWLPRLAAARSSLDITVTPGDSVAGMARQALLSAEPLAG